jgi:hypothetical protein
VLSPILFLVFINDIVGRIDPACELGMFADDIAVWPRGGFVPRDDPLRGRARRLATGEFGARGDAALRRSLQACRVWAVEWWQAFSQKKSQVVVFRRVRAEADRPEVAPFHMGPMLLERVPSYRYLGVVLHESLRWDAHFAVVKQRAMGSMLMLCRIIQREYASPPGFAAVRRLLLGLLVPQIAYGMPFWLPSRQHIAALNGMLVRPLLSFLHLPRSTHFLSLLMDCGVADMLSHWEGAVLRFAARMSSLPAGHPTRQLFESQCMRIGLSPDAARVPASAEAAAAATTLARSLLLLPSTASASADGEAAHGKPAAPVRIGNRHVLDRQGRRVPPSFAVKLCAVRARWRHVLASASAAVDGEHTLSARTQLRQAQSDRQAADAEATGDCRPYHRIIGRANDWVQYPGRYLWADGREAASVRARLRMNRCNIGASLHRRGMRESPYCLFCPGLQRESLSHILHCTRGPWAGAPFIANTPAQLWGLGEPEDRASAQHIAAMLSDSAQSLVLLNAAERL